MQEKRQHPRINKKIKSEVHSDEAMTYSTTSDVSHGGIFISTPEPVKINSEVNLSILSPDGNTIDIRGIVRWICDDMVKGNRNGMGIEFTGMTEAQIKKLKDILEK
jgi:Tfp pilus assembly protein PilZ